MTKRKTIIVSPSGNFYGSEQVLFDFLSSTKNKYLVFVPKHSTFYKKLVNQGKHNVLGFGRIPVLYLKILLLLIFKRYSTLYINEGGHIKYAKLLAKLLPSKKIIVHIRLVEDCEGSRLGLLPNNLSLISISNYISQNLKAYKHLKIYDPIRVDPILVNVKKATAKELNVGIIGRISETKGLSHYKDFFEFLKVNKGSEQLKFTFFGDVLLEEQQASNFYKQFNTSKYPNIKFEGFVSDQTRMYSEIDVVLHLNDKEPLGRIGLESWGRGIPFISFNEGGAGEINSVLNLEKFTIGKVPGWESKLLNLLKSETVHISEDEKDSIKKHLTKLFGVGKYVQALEEIII